MAVNMNQLEAICMQKWSDAFSKLYYEPDKERRPEEFWNSVMAHLSGVGEAIRRTNYKELVEESAYAFCWLCGFIAKCNCVENDPLFSFKNCLSEIVALKFPDACGHCVEMHCHCNPIEKDAEKDKAAKYKSLLSRWQEYKAVWPNRGVDDWLKKFWEIFGGRIHIQTLETIGFHMLEEAGEEAKAVRQLVQFRGLAQTGKYSVDKTFLERLSNIESLVEAYEDYSKKAEIVLDKKYKNAERKEILTNENETIIKTRLIHSKMDFVIEIADTFSWLCAVLLKLGAIIDDLEMIDKERQKYSIEYVLREKFAQFDKKKNLIKDEKGIPKLKCYVCEEEKCKCLFYLESEKE